VGKPTATHTPNENLCQSGGQATTADFTSKLMGVQMHHSDGHHQSLPIKQSTKQTAAAAAATCCQDTARWRWQQLPPNPELFCATVWDTR